MTVKTMTPIFLSRLVLNPRSRQVMSEMASPYEMHRTLMHAFPTLPSDSGTKAREEFGVLFRADPDDFAGLIKVYVQSLVEPDWSFLNALDDYLMTDTGMPGYEHKNIAAVFQNIRGGQVFSFCLRANPTRRIAKQDDPMKGKRVELVREEDQLEWLMRKGSGNGGGRSGGFELLVRKVNGPDGIEQLIPRASVYCEGKQKARKKVANRGHITTHLAVRFQGLLRVGNTRAFQNTLICGIGPAKGYGFGLLSLMPLGQGSPVEVQ